MPRPTCRRKEGQKVDTAGSWGSHYQPPLLFAHRTASTSGVKMQPSTFQLRRKHRILYLLSPQKKKWHKQSSDSAAKEWEARVGSPKSRPPRTRDYISQGFLWVREAGPTAFLLSPGEEWLSGRGAGFVAASERKSRYGGGSSGAGVRGGGQSAIGPVVAAGPEPEDISPTGGERTGAS
ncbi:hypothetical protein ACRRTK_020502 [Alexandromys fortis]